MKKFFLNLSFLLILLISSFSLFLEKDYFSDNEVNVNDLNLKKTTKIADVLIPKYIINVNTVEFWLQTTTDSVDEFLNLKIYDKIEQLLIEQNNIGYIPYDESIYGEGYDPSNFSTWTSDPIPESGVNFTKRWHLKIPGFIDNVGGSSSSLNDYENRESVPIDFHFQPNTSYGISFGGSAGSFNSFYTFNTRDFVEFDYSDDLGLIDSIYRNSYGRQVLRINTRINGNSWNVNNSYFDIVFEILDPNDNVLGYFDYDESTNNSYYYDFVFPKILPTGYHEGYKIKINYNNGNYATSNLDTLEQIPYRGYIEFPIHDKNNPLGFFISEDLYVDFSKPPKIEFVGFDKIEFSFYLYNTTSLNLDNKISIVDSNKNLYKSRLLSDNYDGTYNGELKYEIYDLKYKNDYEINILIDDFILGSDFFYFENLFYDELITTKDKYPNIMIFNYILFTILFILLMVTPYILYIGK